MKVLVLGGTGFFGTSCCQYFGAEGWRVTAFSRRPSRSPLPPGCQWIGGDRRDPKAIENLLSHGPWDLLLDLAAFHAQDIEAALPLATKTSHWIVASSISVYRLAKEMGVYSEDSELDPGAPPEQHPDPHLNYALGKWRMEKALATSPIPWTVFRPTMGYGPSESRGRALWYFLRLERKIPIILPFRGRFEFSFLGAKDLAQAAFKAAGRVDSFSQVFNLASTDPMTLKRYITRQAELLGTTPTFLETDRPEASELGGPLGYNQDWKMSVTKSQQILGVVPTPWDTLAQETIQWFRRDWKEDPQIYFTSLESEQRFALEAPLSPLNA